MNNVSAIGPMGICTAVIVASVLAACGGGGAGANVQTAASESSVGVGNLEASAAESSSAESVEVQPVASQLIDAASTHDDINAVLVSLQNVGAVAAQTEAVATADAGAGAGNSATLDAGADIASDSPTSNDLVSDPFGSTSVTTLAASTSSATTYFIKLADEHHTFTVPNNTVVRYGAAGTAKWMTKTLSGAAQCTNEFFGKDPAVSVLKVCEAATTNAALAAAMSRPIWTTPVGQMPAIDTTKIPTPWIAFGNLRVSTSSIPTPKSDIGAFRTVCGVAKLSFDDPIVFPGQAGKAHLHTFFGNTGANAYSTPESLRTTGTSTCAGGIANRSSYWVPTIIDTQTGAPVLADGISVYYKTGYDVPTSAIKPIPVGLRMIAGDPASKKAGSAGSRFACVGGPNNENDKYGSSIGNCDVGAQLFQQINFPQCWDGVNLDSPDHKSHMAYPSSNACPKSHPVAIPAISYNVTYTVKVKNQPLHWRLSSDNYDPSLPPGYSSHGDWFNGWKADVSDAWARNCVMPSKDCHTNLLGDGRILDF